MGQIKIYGVKQHLQPIRKTLSDIIHYCMIDAFQLPEGKIFHRFFPLESEDFYYADGRTEAYTMIEISIFEGRSVEAKKHLYTLLYERFYKNLQISFQDIEITIFETPKHNWGIRGKPADELSLDYKVNV